MTTHPYLETYAGQTTEELLALESTFRTDSLAIAFETALEQKMAREEARRLTREELYVLAIKGLEREVNNGGYSQFFINTSKEYAPILLEALASAECTQALDITREALAVLRLSTPFTEADVDAAMTGLTPAQESALAACSRRYFDEAGDLAPNVIAFVRKHRASVRVP